MKSLLVSIGVVTIAALSSPALAQLAQGELRGTVVDESGAVLPGVTVTAIHVETGTSRTTTTAANGGYLMPSLPLGTYRVTAELSGFSTVIRDGFRIAVSESVAINFTMKVATLQETVTVTGESPLVDTKKSSLSGRVDPEHVQALPRQPRRLPLQRRQSGVRRVCAGRLVGEPAAHTQSRRALRLRAGGEQSGT
jgi:Carboxypeptidase regulatory-like domain